MKSNYNESLRLVLADEGGYTNDPKDPGGPTNFGITIYDYRKYINSKGTAKDVKNMDVDQAKKIYKSKYWDALDCDNLPSGVDYTCFDYGVNSGLGRPRKALQRFKDLKGIPLIDAINNERMTFLKGLKTYSRFGKGWSSRVNRVRLKSEQMATPDKVTGPVTGTVAAGGTLTLAQYFHDHQAVIIITGIVAALVIGTVIHYFKNKGKS